MNMQRLKFTAGFIAATVMLTIFTPGAIAAGKSGGNAPDWSQQWYIRLTVVSPDDASLRDRGNVLGQLDDSELGQDSHDLIELNPFAAPYLTLVFPHEEWLDPGNYSSDYHATDADNADEWVFDILSDDGYRNITLYWDSVKLVERMDDSVSGKKGSNKSSKMDSAEDLIERMWLEDTLTGERIYAIDSGQLQSYTFNMEGENTRSFRWVMEDRFGRKAKSDKPGQNKTANTYKPDKTQKEQDRINGLPPAVGRK